MPTAPSRLLRLLCWLCPQTMQECRQRVSDDLAEITASAYMRGRNSGMVDGAKIQREVDVDLLRSRGLHGLADKIADELGDA